MLLVIVMAIVSFQASWINIYLADACPRNSSLVRNSCTMTRDKQCQIDVSCRINSTQELAHVLPYPNIVHALNVSNNNLDRIEDYAFVRFKQLVTLNLSFNNIQDLTRNSFRGLTNLKTLDLSFNSLLNWEKVLEDVADELPSLEKLNVTSSPVSWLGQRIASLPNIKLLQGIVSYTSKKQWNPCIYCSIMKNTNVTNVSNVSHIYDISAKKGCLVKIVYITDFSSVLQLNYTVTCHIEASDSRVCEHTRHIEKNHPQIHLKVYDRCWPEIKKWTVPLIPLGLVAMVINLAVMVTVASSATLRNNVAMFFISNMAVGDFLQGTFLVSLTVARQVMTRNRYFYLLSTDNHFCGIISTLFMTAQCLSVLVGFLVVLERYLCIAYSMRPAIRITACMAKRLMLGVWLTITSIVLLPFTLEMKLELDYSCVNVRTKDGTTFVTYLGMIGLVIYSVSFALYAHIFLTVRKSSLNFGLQREGKLGRRIMLVISSNVFFFFAPTIIIYLFVNSKTVPWLFDRYTIWNTVLHYCLGVNSCLNPLLYAFRNDNFKNQLKRFIGLNVGQAVRPVAAHQQGRGAATVKK